MGRAIASDGGLSGLSPKSWASLRAAWKLLRSNRRAVRSMTSPVAPIIGVVQLHAGGMVLVERAASHPGGRNRQAVQGCGLLDRDGFLDQFKKIHLHLAIYWWCRQMYPEPQYICPVGFPPFRSNLCRSPSSLLAGNRSFLRALCHPFRALAPGGGRRGLGGEDGHSLICEGYYSRKILIS